MSDDGTMIYNPMGLADLTQQHARVQPGARPDRPGGAQPAGGLAGLLQGQAGRDELRRRPSS